MILREVLRFLQAPAVSGYQGAGSIALRYGQDLISFSVLADLAHQCTDVAVTGWSVADKQAIRETAGSEKLGSELGPGQTSGSSALGRALNGRIIEGAA